MEPEAISNRPRTMTAEEFFASWDARLANAEARLAEEKAARDAEWERKKAEWERKDAEWEKKTADEKVAWERYKRRSDAEFRRLNKQFGFWGNSQGESVEHTVRAALVKQFKKLGFTFTHCYPTPFGCNGKGVILGQVDAFMENGDIVMIVEIKSKPSIQDIDDHVERMGKLRIWADERGDKRKYLGAIAGVVFNESERNYALKSGFYVVEPSGKTFTAIEPRDDCRPRVW